MRGNGSKVGPRAPPRLRLGASDASRGLHALSVVSYSNKAGGTPGLGALTIRGGEKRFRASKPSRLPEVLGGGGSEKTYVLEKRYR